MMFMRNVTETIPGAAEWRTNAAVLLNYCYLVVRPECEQLKIAMAEYAATLQLCPERRAA